MPLSLRQLVLFIAACSPFLGGASACEDSAACDEAVRVTRDAISKGQTASARQWREHAWKVCRDTAALGPLDQEIVAKEAELKKQVEDAAKKVADAAKSRMNAAQRVWAQFDELDEKKQTLDRLEQYEEKAETMSDGLPDEYKKQLDQYNAGELARRKKRVKKLEEKR
jgi:hypothetical protein